MRQARPRARKGRLRRGVIILPSAFTMGNLFFGIYAVVAALRGDFAWAAWFIVFAATLDLLDGGVARFTRTGSAFGAEMDSLADAISFGVAPALIMVLLYFSDGWSWVIGFVYASAVVVRLARFNVEQGGEAKRHFHGLPTPAAAMVLATHYPFSQTAAFEAYVGVPPWPRIMAIAMVLISILMLSHIPYAKFPRIDVTTRAGVARMVLIGAGIVPAVTIPAYWFFPVLVGYTLWGLGRSVVLGLMERLPERDPLLDPAGGEVEPRELDYNELTREVKLNGR